jgi:hypothetical protein
MGSENEATHSDAQSPRTVPRAPTPDRGDVSAEGNDLGAIDKSGSIERRLIATRKKWTSLRKMPPVDLDRSTNSINVKSVGGI